MKVFTSISLLITPYLLVAISFLFFHQTALAGTSSQEILLFGIVPQQSATKLATRWTPVLNYIGDKAGYRIDFKTAKDIPTFEQRCAEGKYDVAYMNPYHYTVFNKLQGYQAIAKEKLKSLKGIIVVRRDSIYKKLSDLNGSILAFPSPAAFAATILTQSHLSSMEIGYNAKYVSSHDSVYRSVAAGLYPAGGGVPRTFKNMPDNIKNKLRILWISDGFTPHAIAVHPRVSHDSVKNITDVMLGMDHNAEGRKLLKSISFDAFVPADDKEWDNVRSLNLKILDKSTVEQE